MVGTLMGAAAPPGLQVAMELTIEWSFTIVGMIFGIWFIVTQLNLVYQLREREESQKQKPVPLVTSMNRALRNDPFAKILLASFLDSVGWFALAATMPFYLQYVVRPGAYSDTSDEVRGSKSPYNEPRRHVGAVSNTNNAILYSTHFALRRCGLLSAWSYSFALRFSLRHSGCGAVKGEAPQSRGTRSPIICISNPWLRLS